MCQALCLASRMRIVGDRQTGAVFSWSFRLVLIVEFSPYSLASLVLE